MSPPVLFDSHLHLTSERFEGDRDEVLERAREAGVLEMVTIASDPEDARAAEKIAAERQGIWATAGLHPHEADRTSDALLSDIEDLLVSEHVLAVGETGLDFHYDNAPRDAQVANFRGHLELAARSGLPIVVHSRSAERATAALVAEFGDRVTGVLHCFSGGESLLATALEAGWYVSFSGLVTFVPELEEAARDVPADRLLIETDAPYLAPAPRRGRRNEPAFLVHTAARMAEVRAETLDDLARRTRRNARRFYGLPVETALPA